jgi:hypothetical protein
MRKFLSLSVFFVIAMAMFTLTASAQTTTFVITESDITRQAHNTAPTDNWVLYTRDTGTGTFVNGPTVPPSGAGSLRMVTTTGNDKAYLFNYDQIGTTLSSINAISYSTYRTAGEFQQVAALNMEVDFNGPSVDGGFTTLVFEPVYNTDQGAVVDGVWQSWDAYNSGAARWWSTKDIPGLCAFSCYATWTDIKAANPDATILGGFGVNQGGGNPNLTSSVDKLTIGYNGVTTVYDFEVVRAPSHVSPANGSTMTTSQLTKIDWTDVAGAVSYQYESSYTSATNPDGSFSSPAYGPATVYSSEIPTGGTPPATYYWHVRAVDVNGNVSAWTSPWSVTVTADPPPPVYTYPSSAQACMNGGYMTFNPATGPFQNQGECVSYYNKNKTTPVVRP